MNICDVSTDFGGEGQKDRTELAEYLSENTVRFFGTPDRISQVHPDRIKNVREADLKRCPNCRYEAVLTIGEGWGECQVCALEIDLDTL